MKVRVASLGLLISVAGCAPEVSAEDTCGRAGYAGLIGANIAAVTLPASPDLRVFQEGSAVTQDFRPTRTNIVFADGGEIIRVYCG